MTLVKSAPTRAPGIAVTRSSQAIRWSTVVIERVRNECHAATTYDHTSRRKYASTAISVPTCSATSNVLFNESFDVSSVQPKSSGTRIRWPLDEIGRNSERPCTIPRMMAWRTGKRPMLEVRRVLGRHERERDHAVGLRVGERLRLVAGRRAA